MVEEFVPAVHDANSETPSEATPDAGCETGVHARKGAPSLAGVGSPHPHVMHALLSSVRHELGSPLQSMQGFAELLTSEAYGSLSQEQRSFLTHILAASGELRGVMDACLELAEWELFGRAPAPLRAELHSALVDALEHAQCKRDISAVLQPGPAALPLPLELDRELFRYAFEALFVALTVGDNKTFVVDVEAASEYARVTVTRTGRTARPDMLTLEELVRRHHATRHLVWLRLAENAFAMQGGKLLLGEQLECAELRLLLSLGAAPR